MKLKLNRKIRIGLIIVLTLGILGMAYFIYNDIYNPGFEDRKVSLFTYDNLGSIDYIVYLKPNNLYSGNTLGEGEVYITEFVEYIKANFKYKYNSEKVANIKGNYNIIAKVQGYIEDRESETEIWEKEFPLIEDRSFSVKGNEFTIDEMFDLHIDKYNSFAVEIIEASNIKSQARLVLAMDVKLQGVTEDGEFNENVSPNIMIPLDINMFQITGQPKIESSGAIEDKVQITLPISRKDIIFHGIIGGIMVFVLILLIFFVEPVEIKDPLEKKLKRIFKKHGDRLVALNSDIEYRDCHSVHTIDDLVRIADEIDKPILYRYSKDYKDIDRFYVVGGDEIYMLNLIKSQPSSKRTMLVQNRRD